MKKLRFLAFITLAACQSLRMDDHVWFKEGGTPQERDRLLIAAEVQARLAFPDAPMPGASGPANSRSKAALEQARRDIVLRYMTAQGWRLAPRGHVRDHSPSMFHPRSGATAVDSGA